MHHLRLKLLLGLLIELLLLILILLLLILILLLPSPVLTALSLASRVPLLTILAHGAAARLVVKASAFVAPCVARATDSLPLPTLALVARLALPPLVASLRLLLELLLQHLNLELLLPHLLL